MSTVTRGWTPEQLEWIRLLGIQITLRSQSYTSEARLWWRVYVVLSIIFCTLTLAAGVFQVPAIGCPLKIDVATKVLQWVGVVISFIGGVFGGVTAILQPNSVSQGCRTAADQLTKLASKIDIVIRSNPTERPVHSEFEDVINKKYNSIISAAPNILRRHLTESRLPNKAMVEIYVETNEEMDELRRRHIQNESQPTLTPTPEKEKEKEKEQKRDSIEHMSRNEKAMMRELTKQMNRLYEHEHEPPV